MFPGFLLRQYNLKNWEILIKFHGFDEKEDEDWISRWMWWRFEENNLFFLGLIFFNENIYLKDKKIKHPSEKKEDEENI